MSETFGALIDEGLTTAIVGLENEARQAATTIPPSAKVSTNLFRNFIFPGAALRGRACGGTNPGLRRTHMAGTSAGGSFSRIPA